MHIHQSVKRKITGFIVGLGLMGAITMVTPMVANAQGPAARNPFTATQNNGAACDPLQGNARVLGLPFWYEYLDGQTIDGQCRPTLGAPADIWRVAAALFIILLRIASITAVGIIIFGGFKYIMSKGNSNDIAGAKDTISNAVIGLVLTVISARLIGFVAGRFNGGNNNDFLLPQVALGNGAVQTIMSIAFQLAGAFAVMYIAWGGITYARSNGDPSIIKEAKETILYAIVGLLVAIMGQAIVFFVFNRID